MQASSYILMEDKMKRKMFLRMIFLAGAFMLLTLPGILSPAAKAQDSKATDFCLDEYHSCLTSGRDPQECLFEYLDCIGGRK